MMFVTIFICFFFNDTATTEIYTLSLHDALPIWVIVRYNEDMSLTGSNVMKSKLTIQTVVNL